MRASSIRRAPNLLFVVVALGLHLAIVLSIASQPLSVEQAPAEERSVIWPLHFDTVHRGGPAADFFAVYHAGLNLRDGLSPFEAEEKAAVTPYFFPFRYLPIVGHSIGRAALVFAEPLHAWRAWVVVVELVLLGFLIVFCRRAPSTWATLAIGALLLSSPYFLELHMGQFTFVAIALTLVGVMSHAWAPDRGGGGPPPEPRSGSLRGGRGWASGALASLALGSAFLLKVFPLVVLPGLLRWRRFLPVLGASAVVCGVLGGLHFAVHPQDWRPFYAQNFSQPVGGMASGNHSLLYLVFMSGIELGVKWTESSWFGLVSSVRILVLGACVLLVLMSRLRDPVVATCFLLLGHFVSYVHVWEHHMSGVLLIGVVVLAALVRAQASRLAIGVVVAAVIVLALPTPFFLIDGAKDPAVLFPGQAWSFPARATLLLAKATPLGVLFGVCASRVVGAGIERPRLDSLTAD